MSTWVYRCAECKITLAVDVVDGQQAPETAACTQCGKDIATKQFELPKSSGCGCGGTCC